MLSTICLSAHQHFAVHQQLLSSCSSLNYRLIQANISLHFDNCFPLTRQHLVAQTQSNALSLINITSPDDIRRGATVRRYLTALYISHSSGRWKELVSGHPWYWLNREWKGEDKDREKGIYSFKSLHSRAGTWRNSHACTSPIGRQKDISQNRSLTHSFN